MRARDSHQTEERGGGFCPEVPLNWMDERTYPSSSSLNDTFWRWEFLRRRADYRKDWEKYHLQTYEYDLACAQNPAYPTRYNKPVFSPDHPAFKARMPDALAKYHLSGLPNPAIAKPWMLSFDSDYGRIYFGQGPDWRAGGEEVSLCLSEWKVAVVFDLKRPLSAQMNKVKADLLEWQSHQVGRKLERRKCRDEWPLYLRILDAVGLGAPYAEIGRILFPNQDHETAKARVEQLHKQATQISRHFPIS
ncbi:MAG: hypothetical protein KC563_14435 [Nitrospira sp.]|nr:hypothetical protein [Nitrospira sp.]MCA9476984.1 hypothetical protein [Nitrospira sp.]MCB9711786.1 hypothetical protein [Nitrospiraceae bacterium]MDR4488780.1 hypothetical protein [Nitrospirales bacterium]